MPANGRAVAGAWLSAGLEDGDELDLAFEGR